MTYKINKFLKSYQKMELLKMELKKVIFLQIMEMFQALETYQSIFLLVFVCVGETNLR